MNMTPRSARQIAKLTQAEMATLLGMHRSTYRDKENNPNLFTLGEAFRFCEITEQPFDQVFMKEKAGKRS